MSHPINHIFDHKCNLLEIVYMAQRVKIPIKSNPRTSHLREQLVELGVKFGERLDSLLVEAYLPPDWSIERSYCGHQQHQIIYDKDRQVIAKTCLFDNGYRYEGQTDLL
jgi:hypothetical protein